MNKALSASRGFSLIELSIVLVILGLLTGGILSGQALIRASQLRAVTTEYQRYVTAVHGFRDKYFALPGDFNNATAFWTGAVTVNGNGDGNIVGSTTVASNETGYFWQHLALAGLVEGSYTPADWTAINAPTTNPKSKMQPATWSMRYVGPVTTNDSVVGTGGGGQVVYEGNYGNAFFLMSGLTLLTPSGGVLKAEEAWNIDTKLDDGKPGTGTVMSLESQGKATAGTGCGNTAPATTTQAAAAYDLSNTSATACSLVFIPGF
jgi:prepilin-type N-terminal cleavage/methylation domain-containing protein